jgi:Arm DNA-binding domain
MPRKAISEFERKVIKARPGPKLTDPDTRGLVVVITPTGRKTWYYREQAGGQDRMRKLGVYPDLSLRDAREAAEKCGRTPDAMVKKGTFGELLDAYVANLRARNAVSANDVAGEFKRAIPADDPWGRQLRNTEARAITTDNIDEILKRKWQRRVTRNGKPVPVTTRVNRLRSYLNAAFNHASKHDRDYRRPGAQTRFRIDDFNPARGAYREAKWERTRSRVLTKAEAHAFYEHMTGEVERLRAEAARVRARRRSHVEEKASAKKLLAAIQADSRSPLAEQCEQRAAVAAFWCCVMLTGQRAAQLLHANEEGGSLLVMTDSKGRGGHESPKRHALPMTDRIKAHWKFARTARHVNIFTVRGAASHALKRIAPGAVPMDIRRTVETALKDAGVSQEDRAELLSHGRTGIQAKVYERTDYLEPKLKALQVLERWVVGEATTAETPATA